MSTPLSDWLTTEIARLREDARAKLVDAIGNAQLVVDGKGGDYSDKVDAAWESIFVARERWQNADTLEEVLVREGK